jgi:hypothetical protein
VPLIGGLASSAYGYGPGYGHYGPGYGYYGGDAPFTTLDTDLPTTVDTDIPITVETNTIVLRTGVGVFRRMPISSAIADIASLAGVLAKMPEIAAAALA